jgi:N-acyl-D-amino-acid deacylase
MDADTLIVNGTVFTGENTDGIVTAVAIKDDTIIYIGPQAGVTAARIIDASGLYVMPGFIDPHTHSLSDLTSDDPVRRRNDNYLFQGVTSVVNGNDGFGEPDIGAQLTTLDTLNIGTNTALFIGHGALRQFVMGGEDRAPSTAEMTEMTEAITKGMDDGALGLSTGLFYAPGSFSNTDEVIALARVAADGGGIYDSHIRVESNYSIGLMGAIEEVIQIAEGANIPANIAHIKALGTDVWGQSDAIVTRIEEARASGLSITADQYPWRASGTRISNALLPRWVKAGTDVDYKARLDDPQLLDQIVQETAENLRRRGGSDSILITAALSSDISPDWVGKTLAEISEMEAVDPVTIALQIARYGDARIASFNMNPYDMRHFMSQDWVMTSSDGSTGHPRKYASYPKKFRDYVVDQQWITTEAFVHRSTGLVADTFGLCDRGYLKQSYAADIIIIDPMRFAPMADFQNPERLSIGIQFAFVNGVMAIDNGQSTDNLAGRALRRCDRNEG